MASPRIAIVGDANKSKSPALAQQAAADLGTELAQRGCRILIFSSDPAFIEFDVVRGYRAGKSKIEPKAIEVRYPPTLDGLFPSEKPGDPLFDRKPLGAEWEASFFPALAEVDGLVLIGGGYTTKVTGLIAMGARTPLVALAGLGGAAQEVLDSLRTDRRGIATEAELNLMAQTGWTDSSAARCVDALLAQASRRAALEKRAEQLEEEQKRTHALTVLALIGSVLFVGVLLAVAEVWHTGQASRLFILELLGAPAVAGASGAAIRVVWDHWRADAPRVVLQPAVMTMALGFWASGFAGALFLVPQIVALGDLQADRAARLMPFAALIGLLGGLTLDKVFPKLIKIDIPLNVEALNVPAKSKPKKATA